MDIIEKYGIKKIFTKVVKNVEEVKEVLEKYPRLVLKISTSQPIHKTELGLVRLNVTKENLMNEYEKLVNNAKKAGIDSSEIIVQEMADPGLELICGIKTDEQFGKVVLLGIGGIYTEIFKDISMRIAPINKEDAYEMIEELKYKDIFTARGRKYNKEKIVEIVMKVNEIAMNEDIKELDLNPIILYENDYVVVDFRVIK
ncbi:MAG: acetate--CoA ligase family protein [Candidatus Micrarchaeia archaeon]